MQGAANPGTQTYMPKLFFHHETYACFVILWASGSRPGKACSTQIRLNQWAYRARARGAGFFLFEGPKTLLDMDLQELILV